MNDEQRAAQKALHGLPTGLSDVNGHPIHYGDVLDFDEAKFGAPCRFVVEADPIGAGAASDWPWYCTVVTPAKRPAELVEAADLIPRAEVVAWLERIEMGLRMESEAASGFMKRERNGRSNAIAEVSGQIQAGNPWEQA